MALPDYVNINGTSYATEKLSEEARTQVTNLQIVDSEITRLQHQLGIAQTAREVHVAALMQAIKTSKPEALAKPKKPRAPRKTKTSEA